MIKYSSFEESTIQLDHNRYLCKTCGKIIKTPHCPHCRNERISDDFELEEKEVSRYDKKEHKKRK